ncbi:MAG: tetratricopeptide repeat protein [Blastocatellia bacterium]
MEMGNANDRIRFSRGVFLLVVCLWTAAPLSAQTSRGRKPAVPAPPREADAEAIFVAAVERHKAGDLEGAIREYQAFLALRPERMDARSNLGVVYSRLGRYADAIEQYKRALLIDGGSDAIRFNLAVAYYKTARLLSAARELALVVKAQPENRNALYLLADCHLRMGEYARVIELLAPLEAANPSDLALAYMLGLAYINEKETRRGQVLIDRILSRGDSAEAHLMLGTTWLVINEHANALNEFKRAVELNPQLPTVNSFYGQTLVRMGNTDEAMIYFRRELEQNPNDFDSNLQMGILLKQDQKIDESRAFFQRALTVRPNEPNARFYIASLDVAQGKLSEALGSLETLVKDAADFLEAHVMLATVYYRLKRRADGDREQAIVNRLNAERQAKQPGAKP